MIELPLVTIVVTNYNYSKYIIQCLDSIKNQKYENIECIIVDDCSTDNSVELIEDFITRNNLQYRLIRHTENKGQLAGFITGITNANGVFISFIDADDIIFPNFISMHLQVHFSTNVAMTCSRHLEIDQDNQIHSIFTLISTETKLSYNYNLEINNDIKALLSSLVEPVENKLTVNCKIIDYRSHKIGEWHWYPTSNAMFRAQTLKLFAGRDMSSWNYCADKLIFTFAFIIGKSCLFDAYLTGYRRHSKNFFARDYILGGGARYLPQQSIDKSREVDKILHMNLISSFISSHLLLKAAIGQFNYDCILKEIIYSLNIKTFFHLKNEFNIALGHLNFLSRILFFIKYTIRKLQNNIINNISLK